MSRPFRVGLTGGIGSGKSVVAAMFSRLGVPVIDADSISRDLTSSPGPVLQQIVTIFGQEVVDHAGNLNRKVLRTRIFSDNLYRQKLEAILHPAIYARMEAIYLGIDAPYCILCIPLLLETNSCSKVDRILVIDCPVSLQIERTCNRDDVPSQVIEKIINTQVSREVRLKAADDVIVNDSDVENLAIKVDELHAMYLKLVNKPVIV